MTLDWINELSPRRATVGYTAFMSLWIVGFASSERALPGALAVLLLLLPIVVHFGLGYVVADFRALWFAAVPIVAGAVAGGLPSALWVATVLLTAFPGAPLIAAGVWVRDWLERRDPAYVDPWLI